MPKVDLDGTQWDLEEFLEGSHKNKPLTADGREVLDPTPMAPALGYQKTPSLTEQIRAMVRSEHLRRAAEEAGAESFEEADDFEMEDMDMTSPYEEHFDPTPAAELRRRKAEADLVAAPPLSKAAYTKKSSGDEPDPVTEASPEAAVPSKK